MIYSHNVLLHLNSNVCLSMSVTPITQIGKPYELEHFWGHSPLGFSENS